MTKRQGSFLAASLVSISLSGCASVPDTLLCVELNPAKGFCTYTISDNDIYIDEAHPYSFSGKNEDKQTWWEMRNKMVLIPSSSWAELKAYIIKQCKRTDCDQYIKSWDRKIQELNPEGI